LARVELVVGLDTFRPIGTDDPLQHQIHTELYSVPDETIEEVNRAERVIAVGTTAVRALESTFTSGRQSGRTNLFIHRGYEWKVVDLMMTNFHMPRTTLLMMIEAFVGPVWRDIYREAIERRYRFLSFGDAMLLDRHAHDH
jgi:S-adenosylmethionine:tRNA ribosyltransferase-isomerase